MSLALECPFVQFEDLYERLTKEELLKFLKDNFLANSEYVIDFEDEEQKMNHNGEEVSRFMEHCKENGYELPDSLYESYFNA